MCVPDVGRVEKEQRQGQRVHHQSAQELDRLREENERLVFMSEEVNEATIEDETQNFEVDSRGNTIVQLDDAGHT